jgi:L-seryl-tRNA(Ser) seleniumtransferase
MRKSGTILREVGTTNRTRLDDYADAITSSSGLILKVHTSNYRIVGFTEEAPLAELTALGRARGLPVVVDQGSGCLVDLGPYGLKNEPTVSRLLKDGADAVTFSGDKLLGGPQAGLIVGREDLIARMKANPFYRAMRPDKTTIAALEATLEIYLAGRPFEEIPALRMLSATEASLRERCEAMSGKMPAALESRVESGTSRVGGGAAPMEDLPTVLLLVRPRSGTAEEIESRLRRGAPPVIARVRDGWLLLDLRTILPDQDDALVSALSASALAASNSP